MMISLLTVPHVLKATIPPNCDKLVQGSKENTTSNFYDLSKTWFNTVPDESTGEVQGQAEVDES